MFQSSAQSRSGGVQEDALMAVATLVEVLGDGFIKYMDAFKPYLLIGLRNTAEYQVKVHPSIGFFSISTLGLLCGCWSCGRYLSFHVQQSAAVE